MSSVSLYAADGHDEDDDGEGGEGELLAERVHAPLQRRLRRVLLLHQSAIIKSCLVQPTLIDLFHGSSFIF